MPQDDAPQRPAARADEGLPEHSAEADEGRGFDVFETLIAQRSGRRDVRSLPSLIRQALGLAYTAGRSTLLISGAGQLVGAALAGLQVLAATVALRSVLSAERSGGSITRAALPLVAIATLSAMSSVTAALMSQRQRLLGELVARHVWTRILRVTTSVSLEAFESPSFFDRVQRMETYAVSQPLSLAQSLIGLIGGTASFGVLLIALFHIEPLLVPLLTLGGIPLLLFNRRGSRLEFRFAVEQTPPFRVRNYLQEVLSGRQEAKEVRSYGLGASILANYDSLFGRYVAELRRHLRRRTLLLLLGAVASAAVTALTLLLLLLLVKDGRVSVAEAGGAVIAVRLLAGRLQQVTSGIGQLFESSLFLSELADFLALEQHVEPSDTQPDRAPMTFNKLEVRDLAFTYPGSRRAALRGVDLDLAAGQLVALVGENGSGKSTLAKLIAGLYTPTGGTICWDGVDVSSVAPEVLRRSMAVVFQDFVRYQLTALHNIGLGRVETLNDEQAVRSAARRADIDSVLAGLPLGYQTILSKEFPGGRDLSGGQWQRVALARAFYRDAPFIILDEPSAALDPRAEHELFTQLRGLAAGRTVLFISHRFSTVRHADMTYVMADGKVVECGNHDVLMNHGGLYSELFTLQAKDYQFESDYGADRLDRLDMASAPDREPLITSPDDEDVARVGTQSPPAAMRGSQL